ncbi:hypothetical protein [Rhizobium sp. AN69]|uniref:hypothetical protein n=1 Tax=Rhizobium sp. AN69 TaxID=3035213 RepID=UPI002B25F631|nr:hypothetical protein [Rhizobium sp. AN69]
MRRDDVPAVEVVLNSAFKKTGRDRNFDFGAYVETLFFSSPVFDPEYGSVVYDAGESGVTSVILAVPMRFVANGKPITARLLCAFASKGKLGALGAARLSRGMRATKHDMLFSDTSLPRQRRSLACDRRQHVADGKPAMAQGAQAFQRDCPAHAAPFASGQIQARTYGAWICRPYPAIVEKGHKAQ